MNPNTLWTEIRKESGPNNGQINYIVTIHKNFQMWTTQIITRSLLRLQLAGQPNQHSDFSDTHFARHWSPVRLPKFVGSFQLFLPLLWGQQTLQPTVIRNFVFQFDVSNKVVPKHNKDLPVKFHNIFNLR